MEPGTTTFAELLRRFRTRAELTQEELAERAGLSTDAVGLLERGERRRPHADTVARLAAALELVADERPHFDAAARQPAPLVASAPAPSLPRTPTPLFGREEAIDAVVALFDQPNVRLITLTGPGGVGKTRLALAAAERLRETFAQRVVFVSFASISEPDLVVGALATALDIRERAGQTLQQRLIQVLQSQHALLVLDNFEHLLAAASIVSELLVACPKLAVLVTSRAPLRLAGEQQFPVAPLEIPAPWQEAPLDQLLELPAVALFHQRTQAVVPSFTVSAANGETILAICRRLDGLPLAIELAAAWIKLLPPQVLLERLERRLPLLVGGPRDVPARQRTMHDTIAWSYDLLGDREQALMRRLAAFVGGFTLAAAEAIGVALPGPGDGVLVELAALLDASLIQQEAGGSDGWGASRAPRYTLLETVREFALDRLRLSGDAEQVQRQHAEYFLHHAEAQAPALFGADEIAALSDLDAEYPNMRAALQWALDHAEIVTAARLGVALWQFWAIHPQLSEGRAWLEAVLQRVDQAGVSPLPAPLHAKLLYVAGNLARVQVAYGRAIELFEAALAIRRRLADTHGVASCLHNLGIIAYEQGELARAEPLVREALAIVRSLADDYCVALTLISLGNMLRAQQRLADAATAYTESLELWRRLGRQWGIAQVLSGLGGLAQARGDAVQALALYQESLTLHIQIGNKLGVAGCLAGLAWLISLCGPPEQVARLLGAAALLYEQADTPRQPSEVAIDDRVRAVAQAALGEEAFIHSWAEGRRMPLDLLVREALRACG
jgi:predicted ATPase/transcriptional regulator with XRE-family HTH domain